MDAIKIEQPITVKAFEDYVIGEKLELGSHLLEREEIIEFAKKWDPMPFHIDEEAAHASIFGCLTAAGAHMASIRIKIIQDIGVNPYVVAALGWDKVRFIRPGRVGDELFLTVECIEKRLSQSKPDRGIVNLQFEMTNQDGELVFSMLDTILVLKQHT
ncbi:MAG: acyl dehydratase [Rhodospirillaceae bacterium]|jgi:acyl dehydratase|nr:acyl dehydratase [Rhodospirillaceae bacterium]MBT5940709.1 acyl dehydratase [Rhodospirillaceae bacterium]MBT7267143.1 acyl dehydratase [Rhodospirillaceae bacterium]